MIVLELKDIIFALFVPVAAWFSFRAGRKEGIEAGVEGTIYQLEDAGLIEIEILDNGDIKLYKAE